MEKLSTRITDNMEGFETAEKVDYGRYETSFRRWLVSEIDGGRMTLKEAIQRFKFPSRFDVTFKNWQIKYSEKFHLSLRAMKPEELATNKELLARNKELEKQLELAKVQNVGLNTIIDIAEKDLKIQIRKKPNTKL